MQRCIFLRRGKDRMHMRAEEIYAETRFFLGQMLFIAITNRGL